MAEYTIDKIEYGGNVYKLQDNISGYITGTIPTKTSDLTNDSGFITASHTSTYSLPTAVYDTLGGIKPAYSTTGTATLTTSSQAYTNNPTIAARTTTSGKYYGVEIDSVGRLFVNVPWADTKVTTNALISGTLYYPILATGANTATRHVDSTLKGLTYRSTAGTTSSVGTATLTLGNDIASGTANNERGQLFLYSTTNYYVKIQSEALSTNRTITLPNKSGTLAIESDITDKKLQVDSLTSGTMYYPILATGTGTATRQIDSTLNGLRYESISGTTSMAGSASLILGNDIAEGTVNNEDGQLVLYGPSGKYGMIVCNSTANRIVELPDQTGTLATTKDIYESVSLTQAEYDALSSTDKADEKKIYYITDSNTDSSIEEMLNTFYPVGSYYETTDPDFNPNLDWGGEWSLVTKNDVLINGASPVNLPANSSTYVCSVTLPANSEYLIIGRAGTGQGAQQSTNCSIGIISGTELIYQHMMTNAVVATSGQTVNAQAYIKTKTQCVVGVSKYNYTSSAISTGSGVIVAIPLKNFNDGAYKWHRTA